MSRSQLEALPSRQRSAVSNGSKILAGVDGNSALARRYRDLFEGLRAEIGGDLSTSVELQVRNAATLQMHAEELTSRLVRGEPVDPEAITRATNGATRALAALRRLRPPKRSKGRSIHDVLAGKASVA